MWLLKSKRKELEEEIAKLEKKLAKVNEKIARKEAKKMEKLAAKQIATSNGQYPQVPESRETVEDAMIVFSDEVAANKPVKPVVEENKETKRRGRPRKVAVEETTPKAEPAKKRGRPRKVVAENAEAKVEPAKKRGRPRKVQPEVFAEPASAKKRGRPRKVVEAPVESKKVEEAPKKQTRYNVSFDDSKQKWLIKKVGAARIIASFDQKDDAVKRAKEIAKNSGARLSVQRLDGKFGKI